MKKNTHSFTTCLYNPDTETFIQKITKGIPEFRKYQKKFDDHE